MGALKGASAEQLERLRSELTESISLVSGNTSSSGSYLQTIFTARSEATPDDDRSNDSHDTLTCRCEAFDSDRCRHDRHRSRVHDPKEHSLPGSLGNHAS